MTPLTVVPATDDDDPVWLNIEDPFEYADGIEE